MWIRLAIATIGVLGLDIVEIKRPIKKALIVEVVKVIFNHMSLNIVYDKNKPYMNNIFNFIYKWSQKGVDCGERKNEIRS